MTRLKINTVPILAASFFALAASANATDIFDKRNDALADPAPAGVSVDWSGLYIGVHGGWAQGDWSGTPTWEGKHGEVVPGLFDKGKIEGDNWLAGVTVGANKQIGQIVFGVEADGSWGEFGGDSTFVTQSGSYEWDVEQELDNLATLRGRLGYSLGSVMVYGTGGVAFGQTSATESVFNVVNGVRTNKANGSVDENHIGWAAGAGVEWALSHRLSVKAEWLHVDLGDADYRFEGASTAGVPHTSDNFNSALEMDIIRAGLNYKF